MIRTDAPPRARKRRLYLAGLALAVLLSLGLGLAQGANPVLIQVGATTERVNDLEWRFDVALRSFLRGQGVPYSPEMAAQLRSLLPSYLEQRGNELVLIHEARQRGITADGEVVDQTLGELKAGAASQEEYEVLLSDAGFPSEEHLRLLIAEAQVVEQLFDQIEAQAAPSEAEIRVRYLADRALYGQPEAFCARHILVAEEALAGELLELMRSGSDFAVLAEEHGTDGTASRGGDLGCFGRGRMIPEFEEAVWSAEIGNPAGPLQTQFGYHLILVYEHQPAGVFSLEQVRSDVVDSIVAGRVNSVIEGLLSGSGLVVYYDSIPAGPGVQGE